MIEPLWNDEGGGVPFIPGWSHPLDGPIVESGHDAFSPVFMLIFLHPLRCRPAVIRRESKHNLLIYNGFCKQSMMDCQHNASQLASLGGREQAPARHPIPASRAAHDSPD
ncbi:hypothetical protein [Burkholderia stagnalis]|uniref:hypothetical protein n=1 Tax=Burkholderia stagnalis TaxID=1503054 RepID=UPI0012D97DFB|nr:hypothetical protein [Burkholderia stagnalis]